jgi:hypothetical protein
MPGETPNSKFNQPSGGIATGSSTPADRNLSLVQVTAAIVLVLSVSLSLYQLYTAGVAALTALIQRSIHLGAILSLTFLLKPPFKGTRKDKFSFWLILDWTLVFLSIVCVIYIIYNLNAIFERQGDWLPSDLAISIIGTILVLEACRRVIGTIMTGICMAAIVYALYGPYMPELIIHKGYSVERIATTLWLTTEGIFGLPIGVAATFVYVFVLFGAVLEATGGGNFFIDLAYALTGRFSGGPAKTAVVASGFLGSVSGSAVGNVVATGSFTAHAADHGCRGLPDGGIHQHQLSDHHQGGPDSGDHVLPDRAVFRAFRSSETKPEWTAQRKSAQNPKGITRRPALHRSPGHSDLCSGLQLLAHDGGFCGGSEHICRQPDCQCRALDGVRQSTFDRRSCSQESV